MALKVLCACECSQVLLSAWLKVGVDAWSCDLSPSFGAHPDRHYQCDVFEIIDNFDCVFAFPPCTHLTYANGGRLKEKIRDGRTQIALDFFLRLWSKSQVRMLENPLGVVSKFLPYSQIVSPDDFGSSRKKRTCLWLKGLPLLLPTTCRAGHSFIQSLGSYDFRRSILDDHFAAAMVTQWRDFL